MAGRKLTKKDLEKAQAALDALKKTPQMKFSPSEVANLAGVSHYTVLHHIQADRIEARSEKIGKKGKSYSIYRAAVRGYFERRLHLAQVETGTEATA